jgi:hypothetical protein
MKSLHEMGNVAILGYPVVGKSTSAKAIAARYLRQFDMPMIVVALGRMKTPNHKIELVKFSDNPKPVPIPIVNVPFTSSDDKKVLNEFVSSLDSFSKSVTKLQEVFGKSLDKLKITPEGVEFVKGAVDTAETVSKCREILVDVLDPSLIPTEGHSILELAKTISDGLPYIPFTLWKTPCNYLPWDSNISYFTKHFECLEVIT